MSFQYYPQFHRIILQDKNLKIPKKYVEKFWKGISNPIFLRFPNGVQQEIFWVKKSNSEIWFQKNWDQFAKSLKYGNLLTFKYIGESCFKVKIFCANALEINYSNIKSIVDEEQVVEAAEKEAKEIVEVSDESEIYMQAQRIGNCKRKFNTPIDLDSTQKNLSGRNREGKVKKAKKGSTTSAVINMRDNNQNPFFEVIMPKSYVNGDFFRIPTEFSIEHLNNFYGIATLFVGEEMAMEVNMRFNNKNKASFIGTGWKLFSEKYNLQVDDVCKFVMTQREPLFFTIIINRATNRLNPEKFLGYKEGISCDNNAAKRKDTGGSSSSCPKVHFFYGDRDVMKSNTFKVLVNGKIPFVPKEFMKKGCRQHDVVLKMGGKSWLVKVKSCKFDKGWSQFVKECKIEIGDTCLFELIDDKKFVFQVTIAGKNH
ncbi:unnamed protein product [Trifolium pratense]|uniref:Uncharacterized protein n=1 Tax=Trifolium pratense TaxID=57577 RepID=A0ACB0L507_TRIPR|nr:unnamed protein product [Trifolium pratense]